ncbi:aminotransferase class I/II-fold pyridoxal phosphate-dependent enzyme [Gemmatimonadota bacterium]
MPARMPINPHVIEMEYAVRGPIPQRAEVLKREGRRTIPCNIGNPQALGQPAISFYRQVVALLEEPVRLDREKKLNRILTNTPGIADELREEDLVSEYVLDYVQNMLDQWPAGMGAYTESRGPLFIREAVARFIDQRDGVSNTDLVPADPDSIFLTEGASEGVRLILEMMITDTTDGIMIPIPQYPIYSATIARCNGTQVNYYPDEDNDWSLNRAELEKAYKKAVKKGVNVRAIVVINPGNPTGAVMDTKSGRELISFARTHGLAIIADEVYQENLYGAEWTSFAKLVGEEDVTLFSLHSTSKGFYGECGHRGGYVEIRNAPEVEGARADFMDLFLKQASVRLCSNTVGQALMYAVVNPPEEGSEPWAKYTAEKESILNDLHEKAVMVRKSFADMAGVESFGRIGALYHFPRLNGLPEGTTDFDYCMALLEATGLVTVNGSGFGQKRGTRHLRIAFLPPKKMLAEVLPEWIEFHNGYVTV